MKIKEVSIYKNSKRLKIASCLPSFHKTFVLTTILWFPQYFIDVIMLPADPK